MSAREIVNTLGDLETLSDELTTQLNQLEEVITTNRGNKEHILNSDLPPGEKASAVRKLDLLFLQALRIKNTALLLLRDLEETLSLETILQFI